PFKQELVMLGTLAEVELRLLAAAPGAGEIVERLEAELPDPQDEVLLDSLPISIYGGGERTAENPPSLRSGMTARRVAWRRRGRSPHLRPVSANTRRRPPSCCRSAVVGRRPRSK